MIFIIKLPNFHSPSLNASPKTFVYPPRKQAGNREKIRGNLVKKIPFNKMENINFYLPFEMVEEISRTVTCDSTLRALAVIIS